jgi:ribonuclease D
MRPRWYPSPVLITDSGGLARLCRELDNRPYIAFDTEFVGEHSYWPHLCLIQVASSGGIAAAIDPLADLDLSPLLSLLAREDITKVVHSGRQDLAIFRRLAGAVPAPVFDTQIAAMACGYGDAVSYSALAAALAGTTVDKSMQVTDWSRRPLTDRQVEYSLGDVVPLCTVFEALKGRLAELGRDGWVAEDMAELVEDAAADPDPWTAWQRVSVRGADGRALAALREVAAWREQYAAELDVPRARVARDETLIDIAFRRPRTVAELRRIRGFTNVPGNGSAEAAVIASVRRALDLPADAWPRSRTRVELSEGIQSQVGLLQALLRIKCDEHQVAPRLVATRSDLEALAAQPDADHAVTRGWRAEVFGDDARRLLRGELAVTGNPGGAKVVELA